jgi:cyclophilin family peptidyl-prolyl cis-trans isomerase
MRRIRLVLCLVLGVAFAGITASGRQSNAAPAPIIVLETVKGTIEIELFPQDAPKAVAHILTLVRRGFYRGLRFHWVQPAVIQVGDPTSRMMTKEADWGLGGSGEPVGVAEFSKRAFTRGIVGLYYREGYKPESSDSQFFIMKVANPALTGKYVAIGRVTAGMAVVDKIEKPDMLKMAYVKGETAK